MRVRSFLLGLVLLFLAVLAGPALAAPPPADLDTPVAILDAALRATVPAAPVLEVVISVSATPASEPLWLLRTMPGAALDLSATPHLRNRPPNQRTARFRAELVPADGAVVVARTAQPPQRE